MHVQPTDPREFHGPEYDSPVAYWVIFWGRSDASDEYRITDAANIFEVLGWAVQKAGKTKRYGVYVESGAGYDTDQRTLTMVLGSDPNFRDNGD